MKSSTFGLGLRSSLNDVTAAIYETAAILVHKEEQILWELNSLLSNNNNNNKVFIHQEIKIQVSVRNLKS